MSKKVPGDEPRPPRRHSAPPVAKKKPTRRKRDSTELAVGEVAKSADKSVSRKSASAKPLATKPDPVVPPTMEHRAEWVYAISKMQKFWAAHPDFVVRKGFFSDAECDALIETALAKPAEPSQFQWGKNDKFRRDTDIVWLYASEGNYDLFKKIGELVAEVNAEKFDFELFGYLRPMQLGRYGVGQGYDWHQDLGKFISSRRKLSLCIQLSSGDDYDGGNVEFFRNDDSAAVCTRDRGTIAIFPSWMMHRVTPITRGIRWSLVAWVEGPPFR